MSERVKVDISFLTVIKVILVAVLFVLLYWTRAVLLMIFISLILAAAFQPVVRSWSKKVGKTIAVLFLLAIFLVLISGFVSMVVPLLVAQTKQLIADLPAYINRFQAFRAHTPSVQHWLDSASNSLSNSLGNVVNLTVSFVGGVISFFTIIILTLYFLLDEKSFSNLRQNVADEEKVDGLITIIKKVSVKLGNWLRGQLLLCLIMGALIYIALSIVGVPYALTIAAISGVLEIVPIVGPFISGLIAALIAYSVSPISSIIVVLIYLTLSQIEANFLVPKIMQKAIGLPPAIIIVGILIFGNLLGLIGALLAVPIMGIIYVLFEERQEIRQIFTK